MLDQLLQQAILFIDLLILSFNLVLNMVLTLEQTFLYNTYK